MQIFQYDNYRNYLFDLLPVSGPKRGGRSRLAEALGCQLGFVSLVLAGKAEFSLEHAFQTTEFLELTDAEREYFMLLIQKERAGSVKLRSFFTKKLEYIQQERKKLANRVVGVQKTLNPEEQSVYYSDWLYTALHMALLVPELQNRDELSKYLRVPKKKLNAAIEFLLKTGLAVETRGHLKVGITRLHLSQDSPHLISHHLNWRLQAIQALEHALPTDLHYTSVMSISESSAKVLREKIIQFIQEADLLIKDARDEAVYSLCLDYFSLERNSRQ